MAGTEFTVHLYGNLFFSTNHDSVVEALETTSNSTQLNRRDFTLLNKRDFTGQAGQVCNFLQDISQKKSGHLINNFLRFSLS
ncbi:MAG: hypothetical protein R6U84_07135 [Candidatus Cloacimonadales bacterium]